MSLVLFLIASANAQDFGYVAIMAQARQALLAADFKTAKTLITAAEAAAPAASSPLAEVDLAKLWFYRGLIEWRSGDKDKGALGNWRKVLVVAPQFEPDTELLPEAEGQDVMYALRGEVRSYEQFASAVPEDTGEALIFIDGKRLAPDDMLTSGRHLVQIRCGDGSFAGSWYDYGKAPSDYLLLCSGGDYSGKPLSKAQVKAAKAAATKAAEAKAATEQQATADAATAEKSKLEAEKKESADKALADKTAADKVAAADKLVADKAVADKLVADKAAAAKVVTDKAVADKAAADKLVADKATAAKVVADKAAADKLVADKATADKVVADKAAADKLVADKATAAKVVTDKATADKAAAAKVVTDKATADKVVADKVVAEKRAADLKPLASTATIAPRTGLDIPAILLMSAGGGLILGGTAMNFTVVEPAYAAISEANAHPGTMTAEAATAWEGRFDIGRTSTIAMIGAGAAMVATGAVLQVVDANVAILPNGLVVSGRW